MTDDKYVVTIHSGQTGRGVFVTSSLDEAQKHIALYVNKPGNFITIELVLRSTPDKIARLRDGPVTWALVSTETPAQSQ